MKVKKTKKIVLNIEKKRERGALGPPWAPILSLFPNIYMGFLMFFTFILFWCRLSSGSCFSFVLLYLAAGISPTPVPNRHLVKGFIAVTW